MLFEHDNRFRLIVNSDLDLLFGRRNHFVFLLARKAGELLKRLLNNIKSTLDLSFGDNQGRGETNDVLVGWLGLYHLILVLGIDYGIEKELTSNPLVFINMQRSHAE